MNTGTNGEEGALRALSNDLAGAVEAVAPAVVGVNGRQRIASSGLHLGDGVIVTADHALKRDEEITVTVAGSQRVAATLVGRDPSTDLAVLKVEAGGLHAAATADTADLRVGHLVLALSRSRDGDLGASLGVVSTLGDAWRTWRGGRIDRLIRADLAIYPGFSGGPLVDGQGRVLGINTSGLSRHRSVTIPVATVTRIAGELSRTGRVARAYLGVGMQPVQLPDALRGRLGLAGTGGVIVLTVEPGGPADTAGVLIGDVLVALDGDPVADTDDVQAKLWSVAAGTTVKASVVRGGELAELSVTAGEWPRGRR
jgi:S1-C subfamily serine protease